MTEFKKYVERRHGLPADTDPETVEREHERRSAAFKEWASGNVG